MVRVSVILLGLLAGLGCCVRRTLGFAVGPVLSHEKAYRSLQRKRAAPAAGLLAATPSSAESTPVADPATASPPSYSPSSASDSGGGDGELNISQQKASLMRLILATRLGSLGDTESEKALEEVNAIIERLETLGQGFKENQIDGEWALCFTRNGSGSPSLQKAMPGDRGFQNFDVQEKKFYNIVKLWGGKVKVSADLSYAVKLANPDRLEATITRARVNFGPIPLPLPLTGRVGYLDVKFQDEDIRITRGDRGGLFLHMRPGRSFSMGEDSTVAAAAAAAGEA